MNDSPKTGVSCEIVRNKRTGKAFVVLDDSADDRLKLITPDGEIKNLPADVFEDDVETVDSSDLNPQQKAALDEHDAIIGAGEIRDAAKRQADLAASVRKEDPEPRPKPRSTRRVTAPKGPSGIGARWQSDRLTFYKHLIGPLRPNQSFRIEFYDGRIFEMKKSEFETVFNEVVMSAKYRSEGLFSYSELPERAEKFFKK